MSTLLHKRQKAIGGKKFLNISKKLCQKQLRGCEGVEILVVKMCLCQKDKKNEQRQDCKLIPIHQITLQHGDVRALNPVTHEIKIALKRYIE